MKIYCNVCNSSQTKFLFVSQNIHGRFLLSESDTFDVYTCTQCKNVFLGNLKIDKNYYRKYYSQNYYTVDLGNPLLNSIIKTMDCFSFWKKERMIVGKLDLKENIQILDVGCGIGMFLNHLDNNRFSKFGVEINKKGAIEGRKKGITVYASDFLTLKINHKFNVITMWHVLEHMREPQKAIDKAYKMLDKNGVFVFAVPNSQSLGFSFGKKYFYHLDSPRHIFIPNTKNLSLMLKKSGFKDITFKYEFYDYPIDLFASLRKSWLRYLVYPLYPIVKFLDKETLTFIAQKS